MTYTVLATVFDATNCCYTQCGLSSGAMDVDPRKIEAIDDEMARVLRLKSGQERLEMASRMFSSARAMLIAHLRDDHPDWTEDQINREASRRLSHGAI